MVKIIMVGCNGRMGQMITDIVKEDDDAVIAAGIDIINEYFTANFLSKPHNMQAVIVVPEREMPGIVESPCAMPIIPAST